MRLQGTNELPANGNYGSEDEGAPGQLEIAPEAFAAALEQKALGAEKLMECVVKVCLIAIHVLAGQWPHLCCKLLVQPHKSTHQSHITSATPQVLTIRPPRNSVHLNASSSKHYSATFPIASNIYQGLRMLPSQSASALQSFRLACSCPA